MQRGLKIIKGPKELGRVFILNTGKYLCGRLSENNICLSGEKVSKKHCQFSVVGQEVSVLDLKSSNGLFVNSERVTDVNLKLGDIIQVGEYIFELIEKEKS